MSIELVPIGTIHSPFTQAAGTPIQPAFAAGAPGQVLVDPDYAAGLDSIDGFERLWLIYRLDRIEVTKLRLVPYRDTVERGVFATRAPCRPNAIGMSVVKLSRREGNVLHVADIDVLDQTPLLDIKPYIPRYDAHPDSKAGWLDSSTVDRTTADDRFHRSS